jgi:hypothetical protein
MIDIFYLILFSALFLLLVTTILLIRTIILYIQEKHRRPENGTIVDKTIRTVYGNFTDNMSPIPKYQLTVALLKDDVILDYTFEVSRQTYELYNIGDIYKEVS